MLVLLSAESSCDESERLQSKIFVLGPTSFVITFFCHPVSLVSGISNTLMGRLDLLLVFFHKLHFTSIELFSMFFLLFFCFYFHPRSSQ